MVELLCRGRASPALAQVLSEDLEHVDARDEQVAVQKADACGHGKRLAGDGVVARAHEGRLAAGNFQARAFHVGMPATALGCRECGGLGRRLPRAIAFGVEGVAPAEPQCVEVVVHAVYQPRRREYLSARPGALQLVLLLLGDARLDDVGVSAGDLVCGDLVVTPVAVAESLVLVSAQMMLWPVVRSLRRVSRMRVG